MTAFAAKLPNDETDEELEKRGFTLEDRWAISAILVNSDENVISFIIQRYRDLQDWDQVRESYGIDKNTYDNFIDGQRKWQEILDSVPDSVVDGMVNEGWNRREINKFISRMNFMQIDYKYAWEQYKAGKTIDEIVKEKREKEEKMAELDTAYIMNDIPETEYLAAAEKIKGDIAISDILMQVRTLRTEVRNRHRKQSGITEEEIDYCESVGMTNPMDMFQAKYISTGNKVPFENVVSAKLKNKDWISATAEVLNIPKDEYEKQVKQAILE